MTRSSNPHHGTPRTDSLQALLAQSELQALMAQSDAQGRDPELLRGAGLRARIEEANAFAEEVNALAGDWRRYFWLGPPDHGREPVPHERTVDDLLPLSPEARRGAARAYAERFCDAPSANEREYATLCVARLVDDYPDEGLFVIVRRVDHERAQTQAAHRARARILLAWGVLTALMLYAAVLFR